jgi:hypothetical protein
MLVVILGITLESRLIIPTFAIRNKKKFQSSFEYIHQDVCLVKQFLHSLGPLRASSRYQEQCSLVYPATCDYARSGRMSARTGLRISNYIARLLFDLISFEPVLGEDQIDEDRINETVL